MTAALGRRDRLLALRCQPAEVLGAAAIPPHLRFWGVDSGALGTLGTPAGQVAAGFLTGLEWGRRWPGLVPSGCNVCWIPPLPPPGRDPPAAASSLACRQASQRGWF